MNRNTQLHWDKNEEKLYLDLTLTKNEIVKADMYDSHGKCVNHVLDRLCKIGDHKFVKTIKNISKGNYALKISSTDGACNVIRFSVN